MSVPCNSASEVEFSAQNNHIRENSVAVSDDAGQIQFVPGSGSSLPDPGENVGAEDVGNPSDSVYRKTCHQVLLFFSFLLFCCIIFFSVWFPGNVGKSGIPLQTSVWWMRNCWKRISAKLVF